jgi:hypothetical protein
MAFDLLSRFPDPSPPAVNPDCFPLLPVVAEKTPLPILSAIEYRWTGPETIRAVYGENGEGNPTAAKDGGYRVP